MKIVHVQVLPKMTGVQQISFDILKGLDDEFEKFIIFGSPSRGVGGEVDKREIESTFNSIGVQVIFIESLKREVSFLDVKAFIELYRLFKLKKFDIVHTNSTKPGILARVAAKLAGVEKIIHTVHGIAFHKSEKLFNRLFYYLLEMASLPFGDLNISVNRYYLKFYPKLLTKSLTILNGVDFSRLEIIENSKKHDQISIGFFARLDEQKDPITFLKVARDIIKNNRTTKTVKFYLAGDGILKNACIAFIKENELDDFVELVGWVTDVSSFLNSVDIICQPSRWEAFGLNIVEAAYLGVPCVGSCVEGIPEVIVNGETGFLCEPGSVSSFSEKIVELCGDESLRRLMSNNCKTYAKKNFSIDRMVSEYIEIYKLH